MFIYYYTTVIHFYIIPRFDIIKNMKKYDTMIFDLDDTLAETKSPLSEEMGQLVTELSQKINVVIITGGKFEQIKKQVIEHLAVGANLNNFYVLPTSGSSMVHYAPEKNEWEFVYRHNLNDKQKERIILRIKESLKQCSFTIRPEEIYDEQFEDRDSQLSFSALGQYQDTKIKKRWDPDQEKRKEMVSHLEDLSDEFDVNIGGSTTLDVTLKGINKEYGIREFYKRVSFKIENGLFIGDKIFPGGNDYPAVKTGIDYRKTTGPEQTKEIIKEILVSDHNNMVL